MKNTDIAEEIARETGISRSEAADRLDEVISSILKNLKNGRCADLPGVGRFRRNVKGMLQFSAKQRRPNGSR